MSRGPGAGAGAGGGAGPGLGAGLTRLCPGGPGLLLAIFALDSLQIFGKGLVSLRDVLGVTGGAELLLPAELLGELRVPHGDLVQPPAVLAVLQAGLHLLQ